MPSLNVAALGKTRWSEHLVRFVFGGIVTMTTGLIAHAYGPSVGGLFLAFPAILPASLTLLKEHDGRDDAVQAAAGSRLGAIGLIGFAVTTALLAEQGAVVSLSAATAAWAVLSFILWQTVYAQRRKRHRRRRRRPQSSASNLAHPGRGA